MLRFSAILALVSAFLSISGEAYGGSPRSGMGLGIIIPDDTGISRPIGGAGVAVGEGVSMIRGNPALLATFSEASYSVAAQYDNINTNVDGQENPVHAKLNLSLAKFVFPVGRGIVFGWGLSPYTRTDATINVNTEPGDIFVDEMKTSGGINVSTFSLSGSLRRRVYFGVSLNYNFGAIEENWKRTFPDDPGIHEKTDYLKKKYKGYSTTVGILVKPYKETYIGAGYTTQAELDLSVVLQPGDPFDPEIPVYTRKVYLPSTLRLGISSHLSDRLMVACDYSVEQWESAAKSEKEKKMYNDSHRFGCGLRFVPSTRLNAPFLLKIPVSVGFKIATLYYKSYPEIHSISEKAVTFGFEVPLARGIGKLYNSFEYGIRGDKGKNGWDETFFGFGISLVGKIR